MFAGRFARRSDLGGRSFLLDTTEDPAAP